MRRSAEKRYPPQRSLRTRRGGGKLFEGNTGASGDGGGWVGVGLDGRQDALTGVGAGWQIHRSDDFSRSVPMQSLPSRNPTTRRGHGLGVGEKDDCEWGEWFYGRRAMGRFINPVIPIPPDNYAAKAMSRSPKS